MTAINNTSVESFRFHVWKTIRLESYNAVAQYEMLIEKQGVKLRGSLAESCVRSFSVTRRVTLVRCMVRDLGFNSATNYHSILTRAVELGLVPCRTESVVALRLAYKNQPPGEIIRVGMKPVRNDKGQQEVYTLERRREHRVIASWRAHPDDLYQPTYLLVFEHE